MEKIYNFILTSNPVFFLIIHFEKMKMVTIRLNAVTIGFKSGSLLNGVCIVSPISHQLLEENMAFLAPCAISCLPVHCMPISIL